MDIWDKTGAARGSLWEALALPPEKVGSLTLVGGGGKTSLMLALAREAAARGLRVVVTTTTHIRAVERLPLAGDLEELAQLLEVSPVVTYGVHWRDGKLSPAGGLEGCLDLADVVLIEGDGARNLPLKAPAAHEPVIPAWTGAVLAVAGLDAVGEPIGAVCHRVERVCALLGKPPEALVTPADLAALLTHPAGGRKGVPPGAAFRLAFNKADTPARRAAALEAAALAGEGCIMTRFDEEERGGTCWF